MSPVTLTGDVEFDPVIEDGVDVAVNVEASPPVDAGVNDTSIAPLPYATFVPTSVATGVDGVTGITPSCDQPAEV